MSIDDLAKELLEFMKVARAQHAEIKTHQAADHDELVTLRSEMSLLRELVMERAAR